MLSALDARVGERVELTPIPSRYQSSPDTDKGDLELQQSEHNIEMRILVHRCFSNELENR